MAQQKGVKKFNTIYNNLNELFRRINDVDCNYPEHTCALWFVDELNNLLADDLLKSMLTVEQMDNIKKMGSNLLRTNLLENKIKKILKQLLRDIQVTKAKLINDNELVK